MKKSTGNHGKFTKPVLKLPQGIPSIPAPINIEEFDIFQLDGRDVLNFDGGDERMPMNVNDFEELKHLGGGHYGEVYKMYHTPTDRVVAIKKIRVVTRERELELLKREAQHMADSRQCPYVVDFYGFTIYEGDCWICMECLDCSLKDLYMFVHEHLQQRVEEVALMKIAISVINGLHYLKSECRIMHRDVKPPNILLQRQGLVKLCDFGVSAKLIDSIGQTRDVGSQRYLAPERMRNKLYDVRADVWALGVSLLEVALGRFPFSDWRSVIEQIREVVSGPELTFDDATGYSLEFREFVLKCTAKSPEVRPKYDALMADPFFIRVNELQYDLAAYFTPIIDQMKM